MRTIKRAVLALPALLLLAACVGEPQTSTSEQTPAASAAATAESADEDGSSSGQAVLVRQGDEATPTPAATLTVEESTRPEIVVWWPAALAPAPESPAAQIFDSQLADYADHRGSAPHVRIKRLEGTGGILSTLRTAGLVAPAALPDLTLLPYKDLSVAVNAGLVYPLDAQLPETFARDLYPQALALGEIEDTLYGIAYTLQITHLLYRETVFDVPPTTLEAVLAQGQPFAFPAGVESGVSETVLLQYLAAGGRLAGEDGTPLLDEEPLLTVLDFYEQAVAEGLAGPELLDYTSVADYWGDFLSGALSLALVDSTTYLNVHGLVPNAVAAPVVTDSDSSSGGASYATLRGWMWVLTTADPDRQTAAIDLLDWLMQAEHQFELTRALGWLPSQPGTLRMWPQDDYRMLVSDLLTNGHLLTTNARTPSADALQAALITVLRGEQSAVDAAAAALASLE